MTKKYTFGGGIVLLPFFWDLDQHPIALQSPFSSVLKSVQPNPYSDESASTDCGRSDFGRASTDGEWTESMIVFNDKSLSPFN